MAVADASGDISAVKCALALAETHGASVEVIACVEPPHDLAILSRLSGEASDQLVRKAVQMARQTLSAKIAEIMPARSAPLSIVTGKTYLADIRHVAETQCDFVLKMAEPLPGLDRFLFASTDQYLLRKCPCPVWLLTQASAEAPKRILAAVDLDTENAAEPETLHALNRRVIAAASAIAVPRDAEVIVLHAWDAIGEGMIWAFSNAADKRLLGDHYVNEIPEPRKKAMDFLLGEARRTIGPRVRLIPR